MSFFPEGKPVRCSGNERNHAGNRNHSAIAHHNIHGRLRLRLVLKSNELGGRADREQHPKPAQDAGAENKHREHQPIRSYSDGKEFRDSFNRPDRARALHQQRTHRMLMGSDFHIAWSKDDMRLVRECVRGADNSQGSRAWRTRRLDVLRPVSSRPKSLECAAM